ncbi:hypothetical protein HpBT014_15000 [Helicobacter pylori]
MPTKLIEKLNHERKNAIKNSIYLLESYKEPLSLEYFKTLHKILKNNCSDEVIGGFKKHRYYKPIKSYKEL